MKTAKTVSRRELLTGMLAGSLVGGAATSVTPRLRAQSRGGPYDLLIRGGLVVSPDATLRADVGIRDGKVAALLSSTDRAASRVIDATDKLVVPGSIDPHVHFNLNFRGATTYGFDMGTHAAAFGGVTTVIDFAQQAEGQDIIEAIEAKRQEADGKAVLDYALHCIVTDASTAIPRIRAAVDYGVPSFKLFMPYRREGLQTNDGELLLMLQEAKQHGALICLHAENGDIIDSLEEKLSRENRTGIQYFPASRPEYSEAEAVQRGIFLAETAGAELYFVHLASARGVRYVHDALSRGSTIYAETCPHYLTLTEEVYSRPDGFKFVCIPPIRSQAVQDELWEGVRDGTIQSTGSDDCGYPLAGKERNKNSFKDVPAGGMSIEARVPILYSEGVSKKRISVNRFVDIIATTPARIFGLYPRKGVIAPGSDADIVIIDPDRKVTLTPSMLHMHDYSIYDGQKLTGYPIMTIAGGRVLVENGEFKGEPGAGVFLERERA